VKQADDIVIDDERNEYQKNETWCPPGVKQDTE
jgi:hypothetical protein